MPVTHDVIYAAIIGYKENPEDENEIPYAGPIEITEVARVKAPSDKADVRVHITAHLTDVVLCRALAEAGICRRPNDNREPPHGRFMQVISAGGTLGGKYPVTTVVIEDIPQETKIAEPNATEAA